MIDMCNATAKSQVSQGSMAVSRQDTADSERLWQAIRHLNEGERVETVAMWMCLPVQTVYGLADPILSASYRFTGGDS